MKMGPQTIQELCAPYDRIRLGTKKDNAAILILLDQIAMATKSGGIRFSRDPDFFSLPRVQGEKSFTILLLNDDNTIGGVGSLSSTPMTVENQIQYLGYNCDLRLLPSISRKARIQFHRWYEDYAKYAPQIQEIGSLKYVITSIFDENTEAKRSFVERKSGKRQNLIYRPIFPYQNINIFGRLMKRKTVFKAHFCGSDQVEQLKSFLVSNPQDSTFQWSLQELERKKSILGIRWEDFLIVTDGNKILAATIPVSDFQYRRAVFMTLSWPMRVLGIAMPLLGKPAFSKGQALRISYLGFLKFANSRKDEKLDLLLALIDQVLEFENSKPSMERFHILNFMDNQGKSLISNLRKRGYIVSCLPATLYQVIHRENFKKENLLRKNKYNRPDFETSFS